MWKPDCDFELEMWMLLLLLAPTVTSTSCGTGAATLELTLLGEGQTEPGLWSNVSTAAALTELANALGADALEAFRLPRTRAWAESIDPGYNLTNIATGIDVESRYTVGDGSDGSICGTGGFTGVTLALTWVAPNRNISGYPSEPSSKSTPGLHLLHYDAWDRHGNRADRKSRLVRVVQPTDEEEYGLAGCRCLQIADITETPGAGAVQGACGEGTFTYLLDLNPGHPQDISCYPNNFGEACAAWELLLPPSCARHDIDGTKVLDSAPPFCRDSWCYVDEITCNRNDVKQSARFSGLFYSYGTCGSPDLFSNASWSDTLNHTESSAPGDNDGGTSNWVIALLAGLALFFAVGSAGCWYRHQRLKQFHGRAVKLDLTKEITRLSHERTLAFRDRHGSGPRQAGQVADVLDEQKAMIMHAELSQLEVRVPTELVRASISLQKEIGHGEFGTVHHGMFIQRNRGTRSSVATTAGEVDSLGFPVPVAIKVLHDGATAQSRANFAREAVISAQFQHKNVVGMVGVVTACDPYYLVLEFCGGGALDVVVASKDPPVAELVHYVAGVAAGMAHLASFHYVHRDLAARNVLVDLLNTAKVADFGLSREVSDAGIYTMHDKLAKLPIRWCAPEALRETQFGESSDVWSFGVTCIEVFDKARTPYADWTNAYVCEKVGDGFRLPRPARCPVDVFTLVIEPCFATTPEERPQFASLETTLQTLLNENLDTPSADPGNPGAAEQELPVTALTPLAAFYSASRRSSTSASSHTSLPRRSTTSTSSGSGHYQYEELPPVTALASASANYSASRRFSPPTAAGPVPPMYASPRRPLDAENVNVEPPVTVSALPVYCAPSTTSLPSLLYSVEHPEEDTDYLNVELPHAALTPGDGRILMMRSSIV